MSITRLSISAQQAAVNALAARLNGGSLELRTGTMPATANDAATGSLIGVLGFGSPAFGNADANGTATANAMTSEDAALAEGTITWARLKNASGGTEIDVDVTTTTGGGALTMDKVALVVGETIDASTITLTLAAA